MVAYHLRSGDLHFGSVGGVEAAGPRRQMREVLVGPGGTTARSPDLSATQFDRVVGEPHAAVAAVVGGVATCIGPVIHVSA